MFATFATFASLCRRCGTTIASGQSISRVPGYRTFVHSACTPRVTAPVAAPLVYLTPDDEGVYVACHDSSLVYRVRKSTTTKGRMVGLKWTHINGERTTDAGVVQNAEYRKEDPTGQTWHFRIKRWLDSGKLRKMSGDEALAFCTRYGVCARCATHLRAADSVDAGIGPVCAEYFGIDQKAVAEANRAARRKASVPALVAAPDTDNPKVDREARYQELFGDEGIAAMPLAFTATPAAAANAARKERAIANNRARR